MTPTAWIVYFSIMTLITVFGALIWIEADGRSRLAEVGILLVITGIASVLLHAFQLARKYLCPDEHVLSDKIELIVTSV
jgi:hypothetical protein